MKWLSALEGIFNPDKAVKSYGGQFESGGWSSRRRAAVPGGNPSDLRKDLNGSTRNEIVKRSRYIARNSGFAAEQKNLMAIYAVGEGRRPQAQSMDSGWNDAAEQLFREWSVRPEITNRFSWCEVQHLTCRAIDDDGEFFLVKTFDRFGTPKLQLLETHSLSTLTEPSKNIFDGIEFDSVGRPKFYLLNVAGEREPRRLPAASVIHVFEPEMASMARAYPQRQHGLLHLQDELELLAMEKHAVKDASEISRVLKSNRERALEDGDFGLDSEGENPATSEVDIAAAIGGRTVRINENEDLQSWQSNRPNSTFTGFIQHLERDASGGGLPYEVLRDASSIGGASVRLVVSKADRYFQYRQTVMENRFLTPVWGYVIGRAIDGGELPAVKGWTRVKWTSPRRITVDAGREAQANRLDVESGLKLWSDDIAERGGDFDEWLRERSEQARKILDAAGHDASEPIPLWMLYKPTGMALQTMAEQPDDDPPAKQR